MGQLKYYVKLHVLQRGYVEDIDVELHVVQCTRLVLMLTHVISNVERNYHVQTIIVRGSVIVDLAHLVSKLHLMSWYVIVVKL